MPNIPRLKDSDIIAQYRKQNDPPGMWCGYNASLPLDDPPMYYPRVGLIGGMELSVDYDPVTGERWKAMPKQEVDALARLLAWQRYDEAAAQATGDTITSRDFFAAATAADSPR